MRSRSASTSTDTLTYDESLVTPADLRAEFDCYTAHFHQLLYTHDAILQTALKNYLLGDHVAWSDEHQCLFMELKDRALTYLETNFFDTHLRFRLDLAAQKKIAALSFRARGLLENQLIGALSRDYLVEQINQHFLSALHVFLEKQALRHFESQLLTIATASVDFNSALLCFTLAPDDHAHRENSELALNRYKKFIIDWMHFPIPVVDYHAFVAAGEIQLDYLKQLPLSTWFALVISASFFPKDDFEEVISTSFIFFETFLGLTDIFSTAKECVLPLLAAFSEPESPVRAPMFETRFAASDDDDDYVLPRRPITPKPEEDRADTPQTNGCGFWARKSSIDNDIDALTLF